MRIIIKNLQKKIPINPRSIQKAALKTLSLKGREKSGEILQPFGLQDDPSGKNKKRNSPRGQITILFVNDKQIRELNLMYLGRDCPTDVIAFDNSENKKEILADIAISCDTAVRNARIFKSTPEDEISLYVIHGILHLLGYDDDNKRNRLRMQKKEESICQSIKPKP